jgi:hypothetical protein
MSFEPTDPETARPTTEIQPLVPILPGESLSPREATPTGTDPEPPRRTEYAAPFTRHREEIHPGVARMDRD